MIFAEFLYSANGFPDADSWKTLRWKMTPEWATPSDDFTTAHDLIEHSVHDTGTIEDEFMALGAGLLLRFKLASECSQYLSELIGSDVSYVLKKYSNNVVKEPQDHDYGMLPFEFKERVTNMHEKLVRENGASLASEGISEETINRAVEWAHIGARRAFALHGNRLDVVNELFVNLRHMFARMGQQYKVDGRLFVLFDWNGTIETEFVPA